VGLNTKKTIADLSETRANSTGLCRRPIVDAGLEQSLAGRVRAVRFGLNSAPPPPPYYWWNFGSPTFTMYWYFWYIW